MKVAALYAVDEKTHKLIYKLDCPYLVRLDSKTIYETHHFGVTSDEYTTVVWTDRDDKILQMPLVRNHTQLFNPLGYIPTIHADLLVSISNKGVLICAEELGEPWDWLYEYKQTYERSDAKTR